MMRELKICLVCLLVAIGNSGFSQDIKTNVLAPISLSYERFLPDHKALQANLQYKPQNLIGESAQWFRLGLEYRIYRTRKIALLDKHLHQQRGHFMGGYVRFSTCNDISKGVEYDATKFSFGFVKGYKMYHLKRYIAEAYLGAGIAPFIQTSNTVLAPKRDLLFEFNLGISFGVSNRKKNKKKKADSKKSA